ncbi:MULTISPECIES: hypothetical protein [Oscillatoriales]|nr:MULTISPECIES: hypothetical protein [Oscillatoriales]
MRSPFPEQTQQEKAIARWEKFRSNTHLPLMMADSVGAIVFSGCDRSLSI